MGVARLLMRRRGNFVKSVHLVYESGVPAYSIRVEAEPPRRVLVSTSTSSLPLGLRAHLVKVAGGRIDLNEIENASHCPLEIGEQVRVAHDTQVALGNPPCCQRISKGAE